MSISTASSDGDQHAPAYTKNATRGAVPSHTNASSSMPTPPLAPPTNFLTIIRDNNNIKGGYTIDPSLPLPPGAACDYDDDGFALNIRIASKYRSIDAVIELVGKKCTGGPARLAIDAPYGSATIAVYDRVSSRFRLKATSKYGAVVVRLPPTFLGPFSTRLRYGKLTFSPAVQARLVTLVEKGRERRFFIGDYASSCYERDSTWLGDFLCVEAGLGKVKIEFVDEESEKPETPSLVKEPEPLRRKGLFRRLLS